MLHKKTGSFLFPFIMIFTTACLPWKKGDVSQTDIDKYLKLTNEELKENGLSDEQIAQLKKKAAQKKETNHAKAQAKANGNGNGERSEAQKSSKDSEKRSAKSKRSAKDKTNKDLKVGSSSDDNNKAKKKKVIIKPKKPQIKIINFTLIDVDTGKDLLEIRDGMTINLANFDTRNFNIRANTAPPKIGSVKFSFNDNKNYRTENKPPYTIQGFKNGEHIGMLLTLGKHRLSATAFEKFNSNGDKSRPLSLSFNVIDKEETQDQFNDGGFIDEEI